MVKLWDKIGWLVKFDLVILQRRRLSESLWSLHLLGSSRAEWREYKGDGGDGGDGKECNGDVGTGCGITGDDSELFDDMANSELSSGGISDVVDEIASVCDDWMEFNGDVGTGCGITGDDSELFDDMANSELSACGISDVDEIAGVCNDWRECNGDVGTGCGITGDDSDLSAGFSDNGDGILHAALISLWILNFFFYVETLTCEAWLKVNLSCY